MVPEVSKTSIRGKADRPRLGIFTSDTPPDTRLTPDTHADDFPLWLHPSRRWCKKLRGRVHYFGRDRQAALNEWLRVKVHLLAGTKPPPQRTKKQSVKPNPDFPLFQHATGRWAKKIRGRLHYFGPSDEPQAALEEWLRVKDDLLAGRPRPGKVNDLLTVGLLCDHFLNAKRVALEIGELSSRTWHSYFASCAKLTAAFGKHRPVDDLTAADFEKLRAELAQGKSPVTLRGDPLNIRMVLKYGYDNGLTEKPPRYGQGFRIPAKAALRRAKQAKGKRLFDAAELRKIIATAAQPMKAMILLGINCGFGATDCSLLPITSVNLTTGWIDFPRPKTAVERRCPLWPETIDALKEAMPKRPDPRQPEDAALVFLTRCGQR